MVLRVVGVAVLATGPDGRGRVLAARRAGPPELAGRWELPGGKVGDAESLEDAAVREVAEELGCRVRVTGELPGVQPVGPGTVLHVVTAELLEGVPTATEHDELRWLDPSELGGVDWLPPDVPFVDELRTRWLQRGEEVP